MADQGASFVVRVGEVDVHVTRKRVKNINFRIGPDGEAHMSVPLRLSRARAEQIAREHAEWFAEHTARAAARHAEGPKRWESGEHLRVWGELVTLRVEEGPSRAGCELAGGKPAGCGLVPHEQTDDALAGRELVVRVPAGSTEQGRAALVERWLADELRMRLRDVLPRCEERVGRRATSVTLRRMRTRWGSCTPRTGRIRLNTALAECPPACLEMVVVHELCHLWETNHGPRFYALMDLHCPNWRAAQRWLDNHPPRR